VASSSRLTRAIAIGTLLTVFNQTEPELRLVFKAFGRNTGTLYYSLEAKNIHGKWVYVTEFADKDSIDEAIKELKETKPIFL